MAYKDKQLIIDNIGETVDIEFFMKPVYNFKDDTSGKRRRKGQNKPPFICCGVYSETEANEMVDKLRIEGFEAYIKKNNWGDIEVFKR